MSWASEFLSRSRHRWSHLSGAQRGLAVGLILALGLATGLGFYLNRTEWVVLVGQADPRDAAAIVSRLEELKVPYRPVGDGYTITVPRADQYTAKLALAQAGLPNGGGAGLELFDEPKFGATDFDRRVNYLRAQQGELERALVRITEVEYANVKLAIPERSVFVREQQPVTASIMLQLRPGRKLTAEQVLGVVNFVSGAVQGLEPEQVQVVDQSGRLLSSGLNLAAGLEGATGDHLQQQATMQREAEVRVQSLLEPIFGFGNVVARVHLELNLESSRIESHTVGPTAPRATEVVRESATQGAVPGGGGQANGDGGAPPLYQGQDGLESTGDQWRTRTTTTYEVSQQREVTLIGPGSVKRISVGLVINRPDLTPEQIRQIQETVSSATGAELSAISVAAMPFSQQAVAEPTPPPAAAEKGLTDPLMIGAAAAALLLFVGFLFTRRRRVAEPESITELPPGSPLPSVGSALDVALGLEEAAAGLQQPESMPDPLLDPALNAPNQTPRQRLEVVMRAKPKRQLIIEGRPLDEELIQHTDELVYDSPDSSAEVIRQWLKGGPSA